MVSTLKKVGVIYRCSGCMMRQPSPLQPHCPFCGNLLSNWESVMIKEFKENESDIHREDRESHSV